MHKTMKDYYGEYVLCVEGSVPNEADGCSCMIGGKTSLDILKEAAEGAKAVICWGSCACNGREMTPVPGSHDPGHGYRVWSI